MRRLAPLVAVVVAVAGGLVLRPGLESGACAQGDAVVPRSDCDEAGGKAVTDQRCRATRTSFRSVRVKPAGRGLRLAFARRVDRPVAIDVFQVSKGRRMTRGRRVAGFVRRSSPVRWRGRGARDGFLFARFRIRDERNRLDVRRVALVRRGGRFRVRPPFHRRTPCSAIIVFKLERPAFGSRRARTLGLSFRLARPGRVGIEVLRGGRVVRRIAATDRPALALQRLRVPARGLRRGLHEFRLTLTARGTTVRSSLYAQRL